MKKTPPFKCSHILIATIYAPDGYRDGIICILCGKESNYDYFPSENVTIEGSCTRIDEEKLLEHKE